MRKVAIAVLVVAGLASPAAAAPIQVSVGGSWGPYQTGSGGEFTLQIVTGLSNDSYAAATKNLLYPPSFQTFCTEMTEYIYQNTTFNATLDQNAYNGSVGPEGDPLSVGTGWLYSQFAAGTLGYNYTGDRATSAGQLQQTIWWLEQEGGIAYNAANPFMLAAYNQFGGEAQARFSDATHGAWDYGVYALNITKLDGTRAQTQLFYVPDGGTTLMLLGGALIGLGALRRRIGR